MNFTEKIAEQCNGSPQCDLSSQPTYIHKCGKISDYLYVAYKCIRDIDTFDICKSSRRVYNQLEMQSNQQSFYIKSSEFPVEYSSSLDCSCLISSPNQHLNLKIEILWFSLQDNDYLNIFNKNLSGWINPTYEMPITTKTTPIRFITDDSLAYKGFWLKITQRKACKDDWQLVGDNCVKVFNEPLDWRSANQKCLQMNGNLLKIDDVVSDLKLTQYMKSFYPEINSYWIGLRKYVDQYNQEKWMWSSNSTLYSDVSWWPWRRTTDTTTTSTSSYSIPSLNNCVLKRKNEDGYFTTSCDTSNKNSFICQTSTVYPISKETTSELSLQCGSTEEIQKEIVKIEKFNKPKPELEKSIILSDDLPSISINNIILPTFKPVTVAKQEKKEEYSRTTTSTTRAALFLNKIVATSSSSSSVLVRQTESRLNTAILAGIISGIGLVILIINIGVLVMCRRNLKKLLKSSKESNREDMIQEYFEAFNTLHNSKTLNLGHNVLKGENILNIPQLQQQLRTNSSTDDSLLIESAQLFYNPQFNRELTMRQSSAFKPFNRDENNSTTLLQIQPNLSQMHLMQRQGLNQYDKMTHLNKSKNLQNESNGQYAHTYESLDTLEMPNRRALVHLGISSRNYRTVLNSTNESNLLQSPNSTEITDATGNFNLSTSTNLSSTSGASSTHQFIKQGQLVTFGNGNAHSNGVFNLVNASEEAGSAGGEWSPDSAYYSSIPALNNYATSFAIQPFSNQQLQQFILSNQFNCTNVNMDNFANTHLV